MECDMPANGEGEEKKHGEGNMEQHGRSLLLKA